MIFTTGREPDILDRVLNIVVFILLLTILLSIAALDRTDLMELALFIATLAIVFASIAQVRTTRRLQLAIDELSEGAEGDEPELQRDR